MILKNKSILITSDVYGNKFLTVFKKVKPNTLEVDKQYKFDGQIDGADLEIYIPKGCRTEYAKIIKTK